MSKNAELLKDFTKYCEKHPSERFWQALRNWAMVGFVGVSGDADSWRDTFYWSGRTGR